MIHSAIHGARPDVVAAAHSHSPYGKAFSSLGIPLAPLTQDACIFYEDHTVITEQGGAVVFDVDAGKELAAAFPTGKAAIHQNHGLFTVGQTVDEAVFWFVSMERSCQAQLMAMAAGEPKAIRHEYAEYTARPDRASRSPGGSASSRSGRRSAAPIPSCSMMARFARWSDKAGLMRALRSGAEAARPERGRVARPVPGHRLARGAVRPLGGLPVRRRHDRRPAVRRGRAADGGLAARRRRGHRRARRRRRGGAGAGWTRSELAAAAVFGIATAAMNTFFYLAIDRTDLGKSVAIEFIGPIAVAAVMTRTPRNAAALALAALGVVVLGGVELDDNTAGLLYLLAASACWAAYIVVGSQGRPVRARGGRARHRLGHRRAGRSRPFGAPGSGPVWSQPPLLLACLRGRRVLQRHRLRHRPARAAAHPGPAVLRAAGAAAGDGRRSSAGSPSTSGRRRSTWPASRSSWSACVLQDRDELAAELAAPDPS